MEKSVVWQRERVIWMSVCAEGVSGDVKNGEGWSVKSRASLCV